MKRFDCPQCGAAITDEKCPYCGAVFYDFTAITLNEPCYIKIRVGISGKNAVIRARVLPEEMTLTQTPHYVEMETCDGFSSLKRITHVSGDIEMKFRMLSDMENGELYRIEEVLE